MTTRAIGHFDVKLNGLATAHGADHPSLGRMSIDKSFHGDLEAVSKGEMLTAGTDVKGSAGYVAIERAVGTLHGRRGSFALQHNSTMTRGAPNLNVIVVPDSGTEELAGLSGTMQIIIADKEHSYELDYSFTDTAATK